MEQLHTLCVDKSSYKADQDKHLFHMHELTKDSFRKAYEQGKAGHEEYVHSTK